MELVRPAEASGHGQWQTYVAIPPQSPFDSAQFKIDAPHCVQGVTQCGQEFGDPERRAHFFCRP